jgi:hypothetical protein
VKPSSELRTLARRVGIGRLWLKINSARRTGAKAVIQTAWVKRNILPAIRHAPPLPAGEAAPEVHMLLNKARLLEGAWALYSFRYYAGLPFRLVVHSDGSLDAECADILCRILPGTQLVPRDRGDDIVNGELRKRGLLSSIEFRRRLIFGLKLFDPYITAREESYIALDSDILTFSPPVELTTRDFGSQNGNTPHLYSPDNNRIRYSADRETLMRKLGRNVASQLNAGLVKVQRSAFSLARIEELINKLELLATDPVDFFYAEQTLYACELACHGALSLDPQRYTICGDPNDGTIVTGHYCGGGYWSSRFYREGIPRLVRELPIYARAARNGQ